MTAADALAELICRTVEDVRQLAPGSVPTNTLLLGGLVSADFDLDEMQRVDHVALDSIDLLDVFIGVESEIGVSVDFEAEMAQAATDLSRLGSPARVASYLVGHLDSAVLDSWASKAANTPR